jgi:DMSO/TMAO reductase YedYZ molybdopterin-dependent catalytic subunit
MQRSLLVPPQSRRQFLAGVGGIGLTGLMGVSAWSGTDESVAFPFVNGNRDLVKNFPQKGAMVLQRARPPLLETPFEVFDKGVFTPNDRFYVRWHLANIPTFIDPGTFRLNVRGHVKQ